MSRAAVITVESVTPEMRAEFGLSPDARMAVVLLCDGVTEVCCTDTTARQGIHAAAAAWAEAMDAAYAAGAA